MLSPWRLMGWILVLLPLGACHDKSGSKKVQPVLDPTSGPFANNLVDHGIFDTDCQSSSNNGQITGQTAFIFQEGEVKSLPITFDLNNSSRGVTSPFVVQTHDGLKSVSSRTLIVDDQNTIVAMKDGPGPDQLTPGQPLKICNNLFPRGSAEAAALSTIYNIEHTAAFYKSLGAWPELAPMRVEIFSHLVVHYDVEKVSGKHQSAFNNYIADNAAYGIINGQPHFLILPRSQEALDEGFFTALDLWESPFVIGHEFAHHIFSTFFAGGSLGPLVSILSKPELFPMTLARPGQEQHFTRDEQGEDQLALTAINEGYADLFGTYAYGEDQNLLVDHTCMQASRDIHSATFGGGTPKILSSEALLWFFAGGGPEPENCEDPNYNDVHSLGAIFAYGIDQLLQGKSSVEKSQALLTWLKLWATIDHYDQSHPGTSMFLTGLESFVASNHLDTAADCHKAFQYFPGLMTSTVLAKNPQTWPTLSHCAEQNKDAAAI